MRPFIGLLRQKMRPFRGGLDQNSPIWEIEVSRQQHQPPKCKLSSNFMRVAPARQLLYEL